MRFSKKTLRIAAVSGAMIAMVAAVAVTVFATSAAFANPVATYTPHQIKVNPHAQLAGQPNASAFSCQLRPLGGTGARCYDPAQIRNAYNIQPLLNAGITGKGRTIVIVDAFSNPYIQQDLDIFDSTFGLPNTTVHIVAPFGMTPFDFNDGNQVGWSGEISLDVLWAHAIAPDAKIVLALAKTNDDTDIYNTTKYVVDHNIGDVISQSFGEAESCVDPKLLQAQHELFAQATRKGITLVASSGDDGAAQPSCDGSTLILSASSPASDPLVLGVGGTTLNATSPTLDTSTPPQIVNHGGDYVSETAWADSFAGCPPPDQGCSGGGFSNLYKRPFYQVGVPNTRPGHRGVPDVAYDGGVDGGVLTHWGVGLQVLAGLPPSTPAFFIFGGTSAGSPQWSALIALGDQLAHRRLGFVNPSIYRANRIPALYNFSFHDITVGNNNLDPVTGYNAAKGWDPVTGWGTPKANHAIPTLVALNLLRDGDDGIRGRDDQRSSD